MADTWIALTAGLGSVQFEEAADRVSYKLGKFPQISKVINIKTEDLKNASPMVVEKYSEYLSTEIKGYGYMSYKAELSHNALKGTFGECDGLIWVDAGCEVLVNTFTIRRFNGFLEYAKKNGAACFTLDTPESSYTKRDVFEKFPDINPELAGPQIQTTWFILHGKIGMQIAKEWLRITLDGIHNLDLKHSALGERPEFIEHRNDQSIFSLVCKNMHIRPMPYEPVNGISSCKSSLRGISHPFWVSRNRTGKSLIPNLVQLTEKIPFKN